MLKPDPHVRPAKAATIPIAGFLLPYINNTPARGIITTYGKSPTKLNKTRVNTSTNVTVYYGSSVYDTKQMSTLIDNIVQDCKAMGIETLPPEKLKMMITAW